MSKKTTTNKGSNTSLIKPCNSRCSFCFLNYTQMLQNSFIFKGLSPDTIADIIKAVHHRVKTFRKDELIAATGEVYDELYIIVQGSVVGEIIDFEGNVITIETLHEPEIIASLFIFGTENTLPVNVISTQQTRTLIIPKSDLLKIFSSYEQVLQNYLNIVANRAQFLSKKIKILGLNSIRGKIAHYLLDQVRVVNNTQLVLKNSQTQLAQMFGVSRPSLARVIRELHNDGIIHAQGRHINILDKKALSSFLR